MHNELVTTQSHRIIVESYIAEVEGKLEMQTCKTFASGLMAATSAPSLTLISAWASAVFATACRVLVVPDEGVQRIELIVAARCVQDQLVLNPEDIQGVWLSRAA